MVQTCWIQEQVEKFEYPVMPFVPLMPAVFGQTEVSKGEENAERESIECASQSVSNAEVEKLLEEGRQRAFAAGREYGLQEGRRLESDAQDAAAKAAEEQRIKQIGKLMEQFAQERDDYLREVEREVVKLALAVAARILRREAKMDPLLLTGAVRIALRQLSGSTEVRLSVPPEELELWKETVALLPNLAVKPQVIAGEGMRLGDCSIETALGSVDLGIRSQLAEIERGFFDNIANTPVVLENQTSSESPGEDA